MLWVVLYTFNRILYLVIVVTITFIWNALDFSFEQTLRLSVWL